MQRFIGKDVQVVLKDSPVTIQGNLFDLTPTGLLIKNLKDKENMKIFNSVNVDIWVRRSEVNLIYELKPIIIKDASKKSKPTSKKTKS